MDDAQVRARLQAIAGGLLSQGLSDHASELEPLLGSVQDPRLQGEVARLLAFLHVRHGRLAQSLPFSDIATARLPQDLDAAYNQVYALCQLGRLDEAFARGQAALLRLGERDTLLALLTNVLAVAGRHGEVRAYGSRTLAAKNALTAGTAGHDLAACPVPAFDFTRPGRNVIAFSLYGKDPKYVDGAVCNAQALRFIYPGWTMRCYVDDSVPAAALQRLAALGVQLLQPTKLAAARWGTLWRFLVADDPQVDRYLVRDADSLINLREAAAVQEWLASDRHFHVMRDHYDHSDVVLAGLWGGVRGALPPLLPAADAWLRRNTSVQDRTADQAFLCAVMWPTIRRSVLAHDSQFDFGPRRDFPACATLPPGCWVGGQASQLLSYSRRAG